jgi:hypothetical protein
MKNLKIPLQRDFLFEARPSGLPGGQARRTKKPQALRFFIVAPPLQRSAELISSAALRLAWRAGAENKKAVGFEIFHCSPPLQRSAELISSAAPDKRIYEQCMSFFIFIASQTCLKKPEQGVWLTSVWLLHGISMGSPRAVYEAYFHKPQYKSARLRLMIQLELYHDGWPGGV